MNTVLYPTRTTHKKIERKNHVRFCQTGYNGIKGDAILNFTNELGRKQILADLKTHTKRISTLHPVLQSPSTKYPNRFLVNDAKLCEPCVVATAT